jgi:hypothetical protein
VTLALLHMRPAANGTWRHAQTVGFQTIAAMRRARDDAIDPKPTSKIPRDCGAASN